MEIFIPILFFGVFPAANGTAMILSGVYMGFTGLIAQKFAEKPAFLQKHVKTYQVKDARFNYL